MSMFTDLRCGLDGQITIYNDITGKLKGFRAGRINRAEHGEPDPYEGHELFNGIYTKEKPFGGETVTNPDAIKLLEHDGNVMLTNTLIIDPSDRYIEHLFTSAVNHMDISRIKGEPKDIISIWNNFSFELVSLNKDGAEVLRSLYQEMQNKNVAISRENNFIFGNNSGGLSFVILSELTEEEVEYKRRRLGDRSYIQCYNQRTRQPYGYNSRPREEPKDRRYTIGETSFDNIAKQQRKGIIPQWILSLYTRAKEWLDPCNDDHTKEQGD